MSKKYNEKFHLAILKWCEYNDNSDILKIKIHKNSQPSKHPNLRKSFVLSSEEIKVIRKIGLVRVREKIEEYIESLNNYKEDSINFEFENARYATGLCCRECMSVCHKINMWKKLSEKDIQKFVIIMMKWIQQHYIISESS